MLGYLARISTGRRSKWVVIAAWIATVVVMAPLGAKLPEVSNFQVATADELPEDSESRRVTEALRTRFQTGELFPVALAYRREGGLTQADRERIAADARAAAEVHSAAPPGPPQFSRNGEVAFTVVPLTEPQTEERTEALEELRELVEEEEGGLSTRVTGAPALQSDVTTAIESADVALLAATAALVLFLLLLIYRAPAIAVIPLAVVGVAFASAQGLLYLFAELFGETLETSSLTILAVLMFGAGTDYCLLLVARYTSELRRREAEPEAMSVAAPAAGPAIVASGLTVAGAMLTLVVADTQSYDVAGPVYAIGIAVVLLASLTLLPAVLTVIGRKGFWPVRSGVAFDERTADWDRADSGVLPALGASGSEPALTASGIMRALTPEEIEKGPRREGPLKRLSGQLLSRPPLAVALCGGLLALMALGLTTYAEDVSQSDDFRKDTAATDGFELLRTGFPEGALVPTTVLVQRQEGPVRPRDVRAVRDRISDIDGVARIVGPTNSSRDGRAVTLSATFADDPYGEAALERVERMREVAGASGVSVLIGEGTAARLDYGDAARRDALVVIPLALVVISVALVILLRAVVAPAYLLATVVLSFLGTFGLSLVVFDVVFGVGTLDPVVPILAFLFLVALGVDYNMFLMSRVREEALDHGTAQGVLRGLAATGPVITGAGLILAGTFAVLMTIPVNFMLQIGFLVAVGVLIDTFLVRTIMVPAIALVVGDRGWWPSGLRATRRAPTRAGGAAGR